MNCRLVESPVGPLVLCARADDSALVALRFGAELAEGERLNNTPLLCAAARQLEEYFAGTRRSFDLPLAPAGTAFQQECWRVLGTIPYGRTRSYGGQARQLGRPKATRAVGMANHRNPLPILIPCHRVISSGGAPGGYGGGVGAKEKLLALEAANSSWIEFGKKELAHLCAADPALGRVIRAVPPPDYERIPDLFTALVRNIAGQQISGKALETVWSRACTLWGPLTPQNLGAKTAEELCTAGISGRKAGYIQAAARAVLSGELDLAALAAAEDEAAIEQLCHLKGVGRWTAEMLLIFSLGRRDVLSFGDFGIRRGLCRLHGLEESALTPQRFEEFRRLYSPYGTVASLYLWAVGNSAVWPWENTSDN